MWLQYQQFFLNLQKYPNNKKFQPITEFHVILKKEVIQENADQENSALGEIINYDMMAYLYSSPERKP